MTSWLGTGKPQAFFTVHVSIIKIKSIQPDVLQFVFYVFYRYMCIYQLR